MRRNLFKRKKQQEVITTPICGLRFLFIQPILNYVKGETDKFLLLGLLIMLSCLN